MFRPSQNRTKNMKTKDFLGTAVSRSMTFIVQFIHFYCVETHRCPRCCRRIHHVQRGNSSGPGSETFKKPSCCRLCASRTTTEFFGATQRPAKVSRAPALSCFHCTNRQHSRAFVLYPSPSSQTRLQRPSVATSGAQPILVC